MEGHMKRAELSYYSYYSTMDGIHSPEEWINIARKNDIRAFAITDFQDIFAFWNAALAVENLRRKEGPEEFDFKMLYGLETVLEDGSLIHLLVQNQAGLEQLFRLLEIAWQERERPFLRKAEISEHRSGLLVGCPGKDGELYRGILKNLDAVHLEEIAGFYDYLSILPPAYYSPLPSQRPTPIRDIPERKNVICKTIALGRQLDKPVAAVRNACAEGTAATYTAYNILKNNHREYHDQSRALFAWTDLMLDNFSYLGNELAEELVIHAPNRLANLCEEIRLLPEDQRCLQPILPGAFETIAALCRERLPTRYNEKIPEAAQKRMEYELAYLQHRKLDCSILLLVYYLAQGLREKGHLLAARGCLPEFYTAYLLGITETDPLALQIPQESFQQRENLLLHIAFHVSEECWEDIAEIFSKLFPQGMTVYERDISATGNKARPTYTASSYQQFLVPNAAELRHWMPIQKIDGKDTIPYGYEGFPQLFRLVLVPTQLMRLLHRMEELTGVLQSFIPSEDALPLLLRDQTDIPVFGTPEVQRIWRLANPETLEDLIKISALYHSTDAWEGNAEKLLQEGNAPISEIIGTREDVFSYLLDAGSDRTFAFQVLERMRKGCGLDEECLSVLMQHRIPEWFLNSCSKINYLFPKAYCAEIDVIPALKAAWYKAHFPKEYAQAYSELYEETFA